MDNHDETSNNINISKDTKDTKNTTNNPDDKEEFSETAKQRKKRKQKERKALMKSENKNESISSSSSLSPTTSSTSTLVKPSNPTTLSRVEGSFFDDDPKDNSLLLNAKQQLPMQFEFIPDSQASSFIKGFRDQLTSTPSRSPSAHSSAAQAASALFRRSSLSSVDTELFLDKLALGQTRGRPRHVTPKRNRSTELQDEESVKVSKLDRTKDTKNDNQEDKIKAEKTNKIIEDIKPDEVEPAPPLAFQA